MRQPSCPQASTDLELPRIIWLLWLQGFDQAPWIVKECRNSWIRFNPGWHVVELDAQTVNRYVHIDLPDRVVETLGLAHQSDLIRLQLLARYGGVWADATTLCNRPLDTWIDSCSQSGFFAFHRPGRDRLLANWFLACQADSPIVIRLYEKLCDYWLCHAFQPPSRLQCRMGALLAMVLNRTHLTTRFWFHPLVAKILHIYPYFVFHYCFERLLAQDRACMEIWRHTPRISAKQPRLIERLGLLTNVNAAIQRQVKACHAPLFKLTWKYDHSRYAPGTLLHHLIESTVAGDNMP